MSCMAVSGKFIIITKGLQIHQYDGSNLTIIEVPLKSKPQYPDVIADVVVSADDKYLALITTTSKQLIVYDLPLSEKFKTLVLPRCASKIRFTVNQDQILVSDKTGDALLYNIEEDDSGTKLLGHLSLLLDILQTNDGKFLITSDRDEKIRVSCYPNTYNIQTYCLGHKEFVNHLELLPHDDKYLTSTSGDGHVKVWNYVDGKQCYSIDTYLDVDNVQLKDKFTKLMDVEGVEVNTLPIVQYAVSQLNDNSSLLVVGVHMYNKLLVYKLETLDSGFNHVLIDEIALDSPPACILFHNKTLYVYDDVGCTVSVFSIANKEGCISLSLDSIVNMFVNKTVVNTNENYHDAIKVLYKRKFDNVQEYLERKRQRLEKSVQ